MEPEKEPTVLVPISVAKAGQHLMKLQKQWKMTEKVENEKIRSAAEKAVDEYIAQFREDFTIHDGCIHLPAQKIRYLIKVYEKLGIVSSRMGPTADDAVERLCREVILPVQIVPLRAFHFDSKGVYVGEPSDVKRYKKHPGTSIIETYEYDQIQHPINTDGLIWNVKIHPKFAAAIETNTPLEPRLYMKLRDCNLDFNDGWWHIFCKQCKIKFASEERLKLWGSWYGLNPSDFTRDELLDIYMIYKLHDRLDE